MKASSNPSSLANARAPYAPATRLIELPIVLFEILELASESQDESARRIVPLIKSVIQITQQQPDALANMPIIEQKEPCLTG